MFAVTTPENTPMAYRSSTSANPNPVFSPALVEANYEAIQYLLRDRRRQMRNNDIRTELEYFSKDYYEEREMEPRPEPTRAATPPLRVASPRIRRRGENKSPRGNGGQSVNLPPLLAAHLGRGKNGQPLQSSLTSAYRGQALPNNKGGNLLSNGAVLNPVGLVTPSVRWIEDYPLPDELKMPSHIGFYNGKGDPDNFLYLFEGAIRMQKWLMSVAYHMFTYTLKDSARIWWNSQKAAVHNNKQRKGESTQAFITSYTDDTLQILGLHEEQRISGFVHGLRTRSLVEHLSTDLPSTYKGLMDKTYTWVEAREVATNCASSDRRDSFERSKKSSWDNNKGKKNEDRFSPCRGPNHGLLPSLSKSPKEILTTEKAARSFEPPP
ncbi:hypothetical protein Tco_0087604 [Tanacetum coccineum]